MFFKYKKLFTYLNVNKTVLIYLSKVIQIISIISIHCFGPISPLMALQSTDYSLIDMLVKSCYKDTESCIEALNKIHNYQKNAAKNKKFSCQTRLLGLEANVIMAMNSNLKRKDVRNIIQDVRKYC